MDISKIKISGTEYTLKDPVARGEETETEGISHITVDGTVYDCKDIVARGEGSANAKEISKVSVGGKVYQIKDDVARATYDYYFAVYSADDLSLTFYGDNEVPDEGTQYNGKTATNVYTGVEDTGTSNPPWSSVNTSTTAVVFDKSFSGAKPTSCYYWFRPSRGSSKLESISGLQYFDTSNVTTMSYMFSNCSALTSLNATHFDTSNVTTMSYMFYNCSALTSLNATHFDTSNVTDMRYMFGYCSSLTTLDVSNFDTSSVTDMSYMFYSCINLTTIYSDDAKFVTTKVVSSDYMFTDCTKLVGGNGTAYDSSRVTYEMAHIDTEDNPGYFTDIKE